MKRCLITGGSGFVGRHFQTRLRGMFDITNIDIKDGHDCRDFFRWSTEKFDLVIHLAAIVGGRLTIEGNPLSVATDLAIDASMFNWALRTRPEQVVYFSSSAAYPISQQTHVDSRLTEDMISLDNISKPDLTYGWSKLTGEYLSSFLKSENIKTYVFRPFSGYGPDQDLDYPFPSYIKRGVDGDNPFVIWGPGTQTRDFIHIEDIVSAVLRAIKYDFPHTVNLGTGVSTSFKDLAAMVSRIVGYDPEILFDMSKPVGVSHRVADISLLRTLYSPVISLEDGIRDAVSRFRK